MTGGENVYCHCLPCLPRHCLPLPCWAGNLAANGFVRTAPGHIEAMRNDLGGALRFTLASDSGLKTR
jgi:hypothetical protein